MTKSLEETILEDLASSGMYSELRARKILLDEGWKVSPAGAYLDRDEGKSREIDLAATHLIQQRHKGRPCVHSEFCLVAEVKKSEKPWVVFRRPVSSLSGSCAWNNLTAKLNLPTDCSSLTSYLTEISLLKKTGWEGAGIHEAFKKPDQPSRWYSAFVASIKAAVEMCNEYTIVGTEVGDSRLTKAMEFGFFQPLVILDGRLFSAELDGANQIQVEEVQAAPFHFQYKTKSYQALSYRIDLVTLEGLAEYSRLCRDRHVKINEGFAWAADIELETFSR